MRIIGGVHRGRKLAEFGGEEIRPTADRVKENLFNILGLTVKGATVLDLFCGSGNLGLESLSRGAESAHFNDISKDSLAVLKKNITAVKEEARCKVTNLDYLTYLNTTREKFDIIFIDPPYRFDYGAEALKVISQRKLLTENGVAVYERDRTFDGNIEGLENYDERKYGKTYLTFFRPHLSF
ncbi:MAG: 16S rRNA (guanine(966)-N(2))-methyltransferase RsmD [Clostridia bacterium]|nr:16S rRNA (guanine(966)-N(2))-methyltransferase RsmD [Clostridia bacterium]